MTAPKRKNKAFERTLHQHLAAGWLLGGFLDGASVCKAGHDPTNRGVDWLCCSRANDLDSLEWCCEGRALPSSVFPGWEDLMPAFLLDRSCCAPEATVTAARRSAAAVSARARACHKSASQGRRHSAPAIRSVPRQLRPQFSYHCAATDHAKARRSLHSRHVLS